MTAATVELACYALASLSAVGLLLLANPRGYLSRLVEGDNREGER